MALQASVGSECVTGVMRRADDAERSVFLQRDAIFTAEGVGAQEFYAGDTVGDHFQLFDLVFEPADLRLFEFFAAKLFRLSFEQISRTH